MWRCRQKKFHSFYVFVLFYFSSFVWSWFSWLLPSSNYKCIGNCTEANRRLRPPMIGWFFFPLPMRNYQVLRIVFYFIIMKGFFSSIQSHVVTEISLVASIWYSVEYIDESSVHFVWCYIESCCSIFACVQYNTGYNIVPFNCHCHCESIACGANRFAVQQQRSVVEWRVPHQ